MSNGLQSCGSPLGRIRPLVKVEQAWIQHPLRSNVCGCVVDHVVCTLTTVPTCLCALQAQLSVASAGGG